MKTLNAFFSKLIYRREDYRAAIGGIAGIPPGPLTADPGRRKTCFCCDFCISSIWARSTSTTTGANRIVELVKKIHDALQENFYRVLTLATDRSVTAPLTVRPPSENISVRPHRRSVTVSSSSLSKSA